MENGTTPHLRYLSPLRYPGGKAKLAHFFKAVVRANDLTDGHYIEPYAGGASIALALLVGEYVGHVHINDLDRSVYAFWHSVLNQPEALCQRILEVRLTMAEWCRQRQVQTARHVSMLDLGFSTFFLNRTNRSGIIQSGGPIGGVRQRGKWRLNARFTREALAARVQLVASYRDRISLYRQDALAFLKRLERNAPARTVIYLDPPYYVKGQRRLYRNSYEHLNHAAIAHQLAHANLPWIVSYDDVPEVRQLYRGYRFRRYRLAYTARERHLGAEVMFFSPSLRIPAAKPLSTLLLAR